MFTAFKSFCLFVWFSISKRKITVNLHEIGYGNGFLAMIPKAQATTTKKLKAGLHQS